MLEVTWDTAGEPTLAVGSGARYLEEVSQWVIGNAQPMIYEQSDGQWVLVHGATGGDRGMAARHQPGRGSRPGAPDPGGRRPRDDVTAACPSPRVTWTT